MKRRIGWGVNGPRKWQLRHVHHKSGRFTFGLLGEYLSVLGWCWISFRGHSRSVWEGIRWFAADDLFGLFRNYFWQWRWTWSTRDRSDAFFLIVSVVVRWNQCLLFCETSFWYHGESRKVCVVVRSCFHGQHSVTTRSVGVNTKGRNYDEGGEGNRWTFAYRWSTSISDCFFSVEDCVTIRSPKPAVGRL